MFQFFDDRISSNFTKRESYTRRELWQVEMSAREKWRQRQMRTRFIVLVRILSLEFHWAIITRIFVCYYSNDYKMDEIHTNNGNHRSRDAYARGICQVWRDNKYLIFPTSGVCSLLRRCDSICRGEWWWLEYAAAWTRLRRDAYDGRGSSAADDEKNVRCVKHSCLQPILSYTIVDCQQSAATQS